MGVQLAKALGASRVIGVCSGKNSSRVTQVGADQVIDYSKESWWENDALCRNRVDIVCDKKFFCFTTFVKCIYRYDCVGGRDTWTHSHSVLKPWGKFVTIAGDEQAPLRPLKLLSVGASMLGRKLASFTGAPA
jgi:NADPH:quinone reductase-like Zn-dependent oxidoreductase